ncbi:unnamed protein product [Malassezia sympodialis ATCC 42132]|uniref:Uncharacterized protein n=1 Tax=Malassezia sympodialis (strain ATCC 42132) TaxID=1230383 RepID=M5EMT4_MALS4|nr:uncharacterized protein MSY001_1676 [Malassezia sympodialis ATCC 42132]CCU98970.1 unnamed protein product [Malassezia sympodialis ATCC 42132]SHO79723.1 Uncharacterized protein MSYG_4073 [Malassezia sympodialis ATCC 42132]|eukprot:XP_018740241.1 uncharacterized protein MSY001_1676 [Malassezia sympodialis ATCC 42132]
MFAVARMAPRLASPLPLAAVRSFSTRVAARPVPCASLTRSPIAQQARHVRHTRFNRPSPRSHEYASPAPAPSAGYGQGEGFSGSNPFAAQGGWSRALVSAGIVAGTAIGLNLFFNRETRDALSMYESNYLNSTFTYLGGGLTVTAGAAYALHRFGYSARLMTANPWLVLGVGLVASIGGMMGAQALPPSHPAKVPCWLLFNLSQAAVLSPLLFLNPAILARAGLYTAGLMGSLCYVGATAKENQYLWLGGPLLAGVTIVALSSLAPLVLPMRFARTLAATEAIWLYGGLAVFGGFVLWDTQKILRHAKLAEAGILPADPLRESISLELDFINIFTRLVQILAVRDQRRR